MNLQKDIGNKILLLPDYLTREKGDIKIDGYKNLVWDVTFSWWLFGVMILFFLAFSFSIVWFSFGRNSPFDEVWPIIEFHRNVAFLCLIPIIYHFIQPRKKITFDRMNQEITIPRPFFCKSVTIPFNKVESVQMQQLFSSHVTYKAGVRPPHKGIGLFSPAVSVSIIEADPPSHSWSFWVWYMDRNRPLPPSSSFDPYRDEDIKRLKREGFPGPKYPADMYYLDIDEIRYPTGTPCQGIWPPEL